ncbi:hypothetical protein [Streptosporangium sp. NPDC023615]|uniref:hypothetical protein n=1 Tax=Streptosporangium sp. NPDC023615 TaxID=3154794 RepID=UPI00342E7E99
MKSLKKFSLRPIVIVLTLATALSVAATCDEGATACAATTAVSAISPPEPITDGSYRDGSEDDGQAPPEPVENNSDDSDASDAQDDDASGC